MWRIERQIAEKWLSPVFFDEANGVGRQVIGEKTIAADIGPIVLQRWGEVVPPVPGGKTVVFAEAAAVGVIRILATVVPLAEAGRGVSASLQGVGNCLFVQIETFAAIGDVPHPAAWVVPSRQELCSRGRTDRLHEETIETRAIFRERIDVWRLEVGVAVDAEIAPPLIVGENHDDVRLSCGGCSRAKSHQSREGKNALHGRGPHSVISPNVMRKRGEPAASRPVRGRLHFSESRCRVDEQLQVETSVAGEADERLTGDAHSLLKFADLPLNVQVISLPAREGIAVHFLNELGHTRSVGPHPRILTAGVPLVEMNDCGDSARKNLHAVEDRWVGHPEEPVLHATDRGMEMSMDTRASKDETGGRERVLCRQDTRPVAAV